VASVILNNLGSIQCINSLKHGFNLKYLKETYISIVELDWFMLCREIITIFSENHTKHINTLCRQNEELLNVKIREELKK
jgi:hypothetical protein